MNNVYNSLSVAPNTPTVVNSANGPIGLRANYRFVGLYIWSEVDCDVLITLNTTPIGGGRISAAIQTLYLDYHTSPWDLSRTDMLQIQVTTADMINSHIVRSTILIKQL